MIKEEFENLQRRHQESGKTLKEFLLESGIGNSTYSYWRKKFLEREESHERAPISFVKSPHPSKGISSFSQDVPAGATLLFPNGLRARFGTGTECVLMECLEKYRIQRKLWLKNHPSLACLHIYMYP